MTLRRLPVIAVLYVVALHVAAADPLFDVRPGQWRVTTTLDMGNGKNTSTSVYCLTTEDIAAARVLQMGAGQGQSCTTRVTRQSATVLEGVGECGTGPRASRFQLRFAASSPTRLTGAGQAGSVDGALQADFTLSGEWLASQCTASDEDEPWDDADDAEWPSG